MNISETSYIFLLCISIVFSITCNKIVKLNHLFDISGLGLGGLVLTVYPLVSFL